MLESHASTEQAQATHKSELKHNIFGSDSTKVVGMQAQKAKLRDKDEQPRSEQADGPDD